MIMNELSDEEKNEMIKKDPDYGQMICRCEKVTLGEVKDVIHRACGATSINGVKKRCRPGMGACQGGFCEPVVIEILARELGIDIKDVVKDGPGSEIYVSDAKEGL